MAAASAKSLQSCPTLCDPIDGSPPGSPVPGILQARTLEWVAIPSPVHESEKEKSLSRVWLLATPWTAAYQAPPSIQGIFQARVLEWGAIAFSPNSGYLKNKLHIFMQKSSSVFCFPRLISGIAISLGGQTDIMSSGFLKRYQSFEGFDFLLIWSLQNGFW